MRSTSPLLILSVLSLLLNGCGSIPRGAASKQETADYRLTIRMTPQEYPFLHLPGRPAPKKVQPLVVIQRVGAHCRATGQTTCPALPVHLSNTHKRHAADSACHWISDVDSSRRAREIVLCEEGRGVIRVMVFGTEYTGPHRSGPRTKKYPDDVWRGRYEVDRPFTLVIHRGKITQWLEKE